MNSEESVVAISKKTSKNGKKKKNMVVLGGVSKTRHQQPSFQNRRTNLQTLPKQAVSRLSVEVVYSHLYSCSYKTHHAEFVFVAGSATVRGSECEVYICTMCLHVLRAALKKCQRVSGLPRLFIRMFLCERSKWETHSR